MTDSSRQIPLCVFVYGSLKQGYRNHLKFCSGYDGLRPAIVQGKMFRQPDGYPMLQVPEKTVLAQGSADLAADFLRFEQVKQTWEQTLANSAIKPSPVDSDEAQGWESIKGEILTWESEGTAEKLERLSRLDWLEDFSPGSPACLYHRAIVPARVDDLWEPVWIYIAPEGVLPPGISPMGRSWP